MFDELKVRLETLNDLLEQGYLTETEHAAAKENLLFDAGFDIRSHDSRERIPILPEPRRKKRSGCGCFIMILLLLATSVGIILALPQETIQNIPLINNLFTEDGLNTLRQNLMYFIDDLRGNPAAPISSENLEPKPTKNAPDTMEALPQIGIAVPEPEISEPENNPDSDLNSDDNNSDSKESRGWWFP